MKSPLKKSKNKSLNLGSYLKESRVQLNLTQNQVAERLNLTPQFISSIELAKCSPPKNILKKMIIFYKIDPQVIITLILKEEIQRLEELLL